MKKTQPNRLKAQADERGVSVLDLVKEAVQSEGTKLGAAARLGVTRNTIIYHLKKAGLEVDQIVVFREVQS